MKKPSLRVVVTLSLIWVFLFGCGLLPRREAAPTQIQETPVAVLQPSATAEPLPAEPAVVPTETETVFVEPTQTVPAPVSRLSDTLTPDGPWLLIGTENGLFAANVDGSGLTKLIGEEARWPWNLQDGVSPDGRSLAFVTGDEDRIHNLKLNLLTLPEGEVRVITALTNTQTEPDPEAVMLDDKIEAVRAITDVESSLSWSPDGKKLAFIGVQDGPSADLYTYDLESGKIVRLSDGPAQAYAPHFSPDGQYVVHFAANTFGTGAGFSMAGGWAARADDAGMTTLFTGGDTAEFVGFLSPNLFVMNTWSPACAKQNLRIYDIKNNTHTELVKGCFLDAAVSNQGTVMAVGGDYSELLGVYLFGPDNANRTEISRRDTYSVEFLPFDGSFLAAGDDWFEVYSAAGNLAAEGPNADCKYGLSAAGFGALYGWTCFSGETGVGINGLGVETEKVSDLPAMSPTWSPENTLFYLADGGLYRATFPAFISERVADLEGDRVKTAWVGWD